MSGLGDTMLRKILLHAMSGTVVAAGTLFAATAAIAGNCELIDAAYAKLESVPYRQTSHSVGEGPRGEINETAQDIFTGDALYKLETDGWHKSEKSGEELKSYLHHRPLAGDISCELTGTDTFAGEPVNIVATSGAPLIAGTATVVVDTKLWISQRSGLPLKSELKFSSTSARGSIALDTTYTFEFDNVQAPAP